MGNIRMLICDTEGQEIEPRKIFGRRVKQIEKAMERIRKYGSGDELRYEGCYKIPAVFRSEYEGRNVDMELSFDEWLEKHHPDERELERISCRIQDQNVNKSFKFVYGTARKNGYFLEWQGNSNGNGGNPDCWTVSQHRCIIGYVQLISS